MGLNEGKEIILSNVIGAKDVSQNLRIFDDLQMQNDLAKEEKKRNEHINKTTNHYPKRWCGMQG